MVNILKRFNVKKSLRYILFSCLLSFSSLIYAAVTASVDKPNVSLGDTIQLSIYGGNLSNNVAPDLSEVINDFNLLSSSQTQEVAMVNNRMTSETVWMFVLSPKHGGQLTIPAISVGNQQTLPIQIQVSGGDDTATSTSAVTATPAKPAVDNAPSVLLKADLNPQQPYVQSQAIYTLHLYFDKQIVSPQLNAPQVDGVNFVRLGQDKTYQQTLNNHLYDVIEVKYAMFAEKDGPINIVGPSFDGGIAMTNSAGFMVGGIKPTHVLANSIQTTVKSIPAAATGWWLPASDVQISEKWSADPMQAQEGVPITRTIKIAAQGVLAGQLPVLMSTNVPGFQVYPDKPELTSTSDGASVFGSRIEKAAYIPTKSGAVTIPAVIVSWWNTKTNQLQTTNLPAKTFNVLPGKSNSVNTPGGTTTSANKKEIGNTLSLIKNTTHNRINYWFWLALVFGAIWLATVAIILFFLPHKKHKIVTEKVIHKKETDTLKQQRALVERAVKKQDLVQFSAALILLAQKNWPKYSILSLSDIAKYCHSEKAKELLISLERSKYSYKSDNWQAELTWQILSAEFDREKEKTRNNKDELPDFYLN